MEEKNQLTLKKPKKVFYLGSVSGLRIKWLKMDLNGGDYSMRYNSGTYNNQYMVIDTNLFTVGEPLKDNTLTVVEQMPNNVAVGDQFGVLINALAKL